MNNFTEISQSLYDTFSTFGSLAGMYFFKIFLAIILVVIGWIAGKILKKIIKKVVKKVDLDAFLKKIEVDSFLENMGYKLNSGNFLGEAFKWIIFLGFFIVALSILQLDFVIIFMLMAIELIINIIIAIIIFMVSVVVARFVKKLARGTAKAMKIKAYKLVGSVVAFVVYFLALVTILDLFKITQIILEYIEIIIKGGVVAIALALGLAFGLGGKEKAKEILENKRDS